MRTPLNRFNVQVVFPDIAFGIKNRTDVTLTPADVADALEEFCRRIRNDGKVPPARDAVDPPGQRHAQRSTRGKRSSSSSSSSRNSR